MGRSRLEFDGRSAIAHDSAIEAWMAAMRGAVARRRRAEPWLLELAEAWRPVVEHGFDPCDIRFDDVVTTEARRAQLVALAEDVHARIGNAPWCESEGLGLVPPRPQWMRRGFPAEGLRHVSALVIALLRGDLLMDLLVQPPEAPTCRFPPLRSNEPDGEPATWALLLGAEDWRARRRIAESPRAPPEALATLSCDVEELVRLAVARNAATSSGVLDLLARDVTPLTRQAVAAHPSCSEGTRAWLACDEHPSIRGWLAGNGLVPEATVALLQRAGARADLQRLEAKEARLETADVEMLLQGGPWGREILATLESTPACVLTRLASDPVPSVVGALADNVHAPLEALRIIASLDVPEDAARSSELLMGIAKRRAAVRLNLPLPAPHRPWSTRPSKGAWQRLLEFWQKG